jgi:hypothetical protein
MSVSKCRVIVLGNRVNLSRLLVLKRKKDTFVASKGLTALYTDIGGEVHSRDIKNTPIGQIAQNY